MSTQAAFKGLQARTSTATNGLDLRLTSPPTPDSARVKQVLGSVTRQQEEEEELEFARVTVDAQLRGATHAATPSSTEVLSALPQVAGEHKYHPECFVCLSCKVVIEDRDTYALVERSKLYW